MFVEKHIDKGELSWNMLERKLSTVEVTETKLVVTEKGLSEMEVARRREDRFLVLVFDFF